MVLFQCSLMDHMKSRYTTKKIDICYPPKNTVGLNPTSNSEHFSVDINDDEEDGFPTYQLSTNDDEENYET